MQELFHLSIIVISIRIRTTCHRFISIAPHTLPAMAEASESRMDKSLGILTARFLKIIQSSEEDVIDLKLVADSLQSHQRRRIYDITHVLEGIGLIEKVSKKLIKWRYVCTHTIYFSSKIQPLTFFAR